MCICNVYVLGRGEVQGRGVLAVCVDGDTIYVSVYLVKESDGLGEETISHSGSGGTYAMEPFDR